MNDNHLKILKIIRDENMPLGASFLADKIGLPQATVGRILSTLESNEYLEKISNKGRFVTKKGLDFITQKEQLNDKLFTAISIIESAESDEKHKLDEILELRLTIEPFSAERACLNVTDEDINYLDKIMLEHIYDIKCGGIGSEQDLQLHLKIAELSGNQTLHNILRLILTDENAYTKFSMVASHITDTQLKQHSDIVEAIRARDSQKAKEAMMVHLKQVIEDVRIHYN